jgi:hypothetical protein
MSYSVWVEIEGSEPQDPALGLSIMLEGAATGTFDDLREAVDFGNAIQRIGKRIGEVHEFLAEYKEAIAGFKNEYGEVEDRDLRDFDEVRNQYGEEALTLLDELARNLEPKEVPRG